MSKNYIFHAGEATVLAADGQFTDAMPEILIGRTDGRLTLQDPSTGQRIDLESCGPSNAAVFASLRLAGPTAP